MTEETQRILRKIKVKKVTIGAKVLNADGTEKYTLPPFFLKYGRLRWFWFLWCKITK